PGPAGGEHLLYGADPSLYDSGWYYQRSCIRLSAGSCGTTGKLSHRQNHAMKWFTKSASSKPVVLLVEDNITQANITADIIRETDLYEVVIAHNGEEALRELERHERGFDFLTNGISCILLDWQMPKMNGEAFLHILRSKEQSSPFKRHTPVVIIS